MKSGVNIEATVAGKAKALTIPVIASGGITSLGDLKALCRIELEKGLLAAWPRKDVKEGTLDLKAAVALADDLSVKIRRSRGQCFFSYTVDHPGVETGLFLNRIVDFAR